MITQLEHDMEVGLYCAALPCTHHNHSRSLLMILLKKKKLIHSTSVEMCGLFSDSFIRDDQMIFRMKEEQKNKKNPRYVLSEVNKRNAIMKQGKVNGVEIMQKVR